ncbi:TMV resistance protein N-like [Bidens hawaiensis]|uniref:TMV resistance protein N-like n=1 Tax=Bidens hawaiensis TaxID=980011 RepID=UPI004049E30A
MASTSQSSLATSRTVFLSFRGEDTHKTLGDHLYAALQQQKIIPMNEAHPLIRGIGIDQSLYRAVQEAEVAVVVINKNYANTSWSLNELAAIMQCRYERGLLVIPIFDHVDPSELRRQNGMYGAALSGHELENAEQVESWRKAMVDLANIPGYVVTGDDDEEDAERIAYSITHRYLNMLSRKEATAGTSGCTNLIGMETRMQDLRSLLDIGSGGVRMVGVSGIWGSGKSTLASSVYDELKHEFEGCCFVKNVRAESRKHGLKTLQEKILSDVFKSKVRLKSIEQGISMMRRRLCQKKVLIVLDDVDHVDHLQMLVGSFDWFGEGSRIIFTTRNQDLVKAHNCVTHNVRMLDDEEAIELFSWSAFGASRPEEGYEKLSQSMVSKLGGHPVTLKNLGSFLHGKDKLEWTSALAKLEGVPVDEILEKGNPGDDGLSRNTFIWFAT